MIFIVVRNEDQHWAEDFLLRYGHVITNVREHCGSCKMTLAEAFRSSEPSGNQVRAFLNPDANQPLHFFELDVANDWTDTSPHREWISNLGRFGRRPSY